MPMVFFGETDNTLRISHTQFVFYISEVKLFLDSTGLLVMRNKLPMNKICKGKVCRRVPKEMELLFRIQSLACFDTFDEAFDNYFRSKRDFTLFRFFLDPGESLRLYIADKQGRYG